MFNKNVTASTDVITRITTASVSIWYGETST